MKTFDLKLFSEEIINARGNKTLSEISKSTGVKITALHRYEKQTQEPKIQNVVAICEWLGKKVDYFVK